jgi:hypothetical protein
MRRIKSGWLVVALIVLAGAVWLAGPGSQSAAAQTAVRIFGTLSGAAKAVAVDSTGRLRVIIEGGGAAFDAAVTIVINAIGTTSTRGLSVDNSTAAAAGAQQYSPMLCQEGQGWKTNATAGSQSVEFCWEVQPVQGAAAPTGNYILKASINGGAFSTVGTFTNGGGFTSVGSLTTGNGASFTWAGSFPSRILSFADGGVRVANNAVSNTFDITLADWGTTLSAEGVSVANGTSVFIGATGAGELRIDATASNDGCRFYLRGVPVAVREIEDIGSICSPTKDNAATINIFYDAGGASGAGYYLQNNKATQALKVILFGG